MCTIVCMTIRCIPAKPFVKLTYTPIVNRPSGRDFYDEFKAVSYSDEHTFVEVTVFSKDRAVITTAVFTDADDPKIHVNKLGR